LPAAPRPSVTSRIKKRDASRDARHEDLAARLEHAESTIQAIYSGEVDAVVVKGPNGPKVYTLEGSDHPYRVLVEQMHDGTLTLDMDRVVLYSNGRFAKMIGAEVSSLAGSRLDAVLKPEDLSTFSALMEAAAQCGHSAGELSVMSRLGDLIPVRVSLTPIDTAGMKAICLVTSDLRDQRRNEAIVKEEQLSRLILEQAGEAIVVIDPQGVIVRASESARALAGRPILAMHFDQAFVLDTGGAPLDAASIFAATRAGAVAGLETGLVKNDGAQASVMFSASPLCGHRDAAPESKELLGCVITLTDITAHKRAEQTLALQAEELQQANSDLRQFAHSASHDLREPLRQLAVFNELLQQKYQTQLGPEAAALIQHSVEAAHRMERLLKGLLDYTQAADAAHRSAGPSEANEVVAKTLGTFDAQIRETGAVVESDALPRLHVHEVHLTQLFQNLIGNALKYRSEAPPRIRVGAEPMGAMWQLWVCDNGIGIARDYQEQIFGLFQRLHGGGKYDGSGIGLAICQKIVQRYGGRIWVESEPGQGSKFAFTLPGDRK
jgi:PAS domain S-box-containing protein